jgi:hypothetical protein
MMEAGWIMLGKHKGKIVRAMTSIFLLGMYSVYKEQECKKMLKRLCGRGRL